MSLYIGQKEVDFINNVNEELITDISSQYIDYYRVDSKNSPQDNLYGESLNKTFNLPVRIYCLVDYIEPTSVTGIEGVDIQYSIECQFLRSILEEVNIYPREGDFVKFGEIYYEIKNVLEVKQVAGQPIYKFDIICQCAPTRVDSLNIIDYNK